MDRFDFQIRGSAGPIACRRVGDARGRPILLIHGATFCGQTAFTLDLPGIPSIGTALAAAGFCCTTFAIRGYGGSAGPADGASVTTSAALEDIDAVAVHIRAAGGTRAFDVLGWSWGGRTSALFAQRDPEGVRRLVLFAPALGTGHRAPATAPPPGGYRTNDRDSVLDRLETEFTDPEAARLLADHVVANEPRSPAGALMGATLAADPARIVAPTLLVFGAADRIYQAGAAAEFFHQLPGRDKALRVIPDAGHLAQFQRAAPKLRDAILRFLLAA